MGAVAPADMIHVVHSHITYGAASHDAADVACFASVDTLCTVCACTIRFGIA